MANRKKLPEDKCTRVNVSIPLKLWDRFTDDADLNGRSYSSVICDLIVKYLSDEYDLIDTGIKFAKVKNENTCINLSAVKFIHMPNDKGEIIIELEGYPNHMDPGEKYSIELPFVDNPMEILKL